jgi:hypothetical protein
MTVLATLAHPVTVNHGRAGGTLDATKHLLIAAPRLATATELGAHWHASGQVGAATSPGRGVASMN